MAGKSAHFQITLALELDFIHSCTHDSHCKMLEHWQHHKSVTTVKDAHIIFKSSFQIYLTVYTWTGRSRHITAQLEPDHRRFRNVDV